jgi:hypothetical protein
VELTDLALSRAKMSKLRVAHTSTSSPCQISTGGFRVACAICSTISVIASMATLVS